MLFLNLSMDSSENLSISLLLLPFLVSLAINLFFEVT
jgi:hypothetical protein